MFDRDTKAPEGLVVCFVFGNEFTSSRLVAAQAGLRVTLSETLIAVIGDDPHLRLKLQVVVLE